MAKGSIHNKILLALLTAVAVMFFFSFLLVPLYNVFCEVTGLNGKIYGPSDFFKTEKEIKDFCNLTYDVKFPMFTKVNVRGEKAHPFYKNLAAETNSSPKWNFWKYLINKDGEVVKSYSMVTSPKGDKLVSMIDKLLAE